MYVQVEKPKENKSRAITNSVAQIKSGDKQGSGFVINRSQSILQLKMPLSKTMLTKLDCSRGTTGLVDNRPQSNALGVLQKASQAGICSAALQRQITMKDSGAARRSDGDEQSLRGEVTTAISDNDYDDLILTRNQLQQSIDARSSVDGRDAGHEYRLQLERTLIQTIRAALVPHQKRRAQQRARQQRQKAARILAEERRAHLATRYGAFSAFEMDDDLAESAPEVSEKKPEAFSGKPKKKKKKVTSGPIDLSTMKRPPKDDPDDEGSGGGLWGFLLGLKKSVFG